MTILAILMSLVLHNSQQGAIELWHGKTFSYEIYCKKRDNFYTVEVKGPKYYSIEMVPFTQNTIDTIAQNNYQALIVKSPKCLEFNNVRLTKCNLKPVPITEDVMKKRITLFQNFLYGKLQQKMADFKMPENNEIIVAFQKYDKDGDIQKIIDNYIQKCP
jgi:hypothetical protein